METDPQSRRKRRETILTLSLVGILGGAFVFFLNLVSLGIFFYVVSAVLGLVAVGFLHYAIWGYALSQQVAGEREEERIRQLMQSEHEPEYPGHDRAEHS